MGPEPHGIRVRGDLSQVPEKLPERRAEAPPSPVPLSSTSPQRLSLLGPALTSAGCTAESVAQTARRRRTKLRVARRRRPASRRVPGPLRRGATVNQRRWPTARASASRRPAPATRPRGGARDRTGVSIQWLYKARRLRQGTRSGVAAAWPAQIRVTQIHKVAL